jgi:hypothetical protein
MSNTPDTTAVATTTPTAPAPVDINQRVEQYVMLRDKIKELDDAHKEKMKPFKETLEKLGNVLMDHLNTAGAESVKTSGGTFYKSSKKSASLADADAFMTFVIEKGLFELMDRKANATAVEDFVNENGVLPPGVKFSMVTTINVRRGT